MGEGLILFPVVSSAEDISCTSNTQKREPNFQALPLLSGERLGVRLGVRLWRDGRKSMRMTFLIGHDLPSWACKTNLLIQPSLVAAEPTVLFPSNSFTEIIRYKITLRPLLSCNIIQDQCYYIIFDHFLGITCTSFQKN